jgi:hypothetical protein
VADETQAGGQSSSQDESQQTSGDASQQGNGSQANQQTQAGQANGQTNQSQQNNQGGQQQQAPARPEYVPEKFWNAKDGKISDDKALAAHFNEIVARDAAEAVRRNALPQNADAYKVELPGDFKPPQGVEFKFNNDDPLLSQARTMAHEMGLKQEDFSKLLGLYAGAQVASQQQITAARNAEIAKLGTTGPARIDALTTFFSSYLSEAEGRQLMSRMFTAADVAIAEKLVGKISSQGGASFRANGREPPDAPGKVSNEVFAKMSSAERLDYARKFPQEQFQSNGAGR